MRYRDLHELSLGERVVLTLIIVLVLLFGLALFGYLSGGWDVADAKVQVTCMDPTEREKIRDIMLKAIDRGLEDQIAHLFETWMKDPSDQPQRAQVGSNNAVNAHVRARTAALTWNPPPCSEGKQP
jgi:hypothetical protein